MTALVREAGLHGVVVEFDDHVGLGTIAGDDGGSYLFHCVEIADGSRSIAVGTAVGFSRMRKFGRWEAGDIVP